MRPCQRPGEIASQGRARPIEDLARIRVASSSMVASAKALHARRPSATAHRMLEPVRVLLLQWTGVVCRNSADHSRGLSIVEIEQSAETLPPSNVCFQTDRRRCSLKKLVLASLMIPLPMVVLHILVDEPL